MSDIEKLLAALVVVSLLLLIVVIFYEEKRWTEFSAANNCKKVAQMTGDVQVGVGYGMTSGGQFGTLITTSTTPPKTGWLCDDGVTYWR